jgi:TonB family protein
VRLIDLVESSGRPLQARLGRAYAGLAATYHAGARHDLAVKTFDQAIALSRRQEGLLSDRQVPLLEKYVDSLTQLGRYADALQVQKYRLRIATRQYGTRAIGVTPTLEAIGRWYAAVGAYDAARRLLKHAISVVEEVEGPNSPKLVGPLLALAATDRRQLLDPVTAAQDAVDGDRGGAFGEQPNLPGVSAMPVSSVVAEGEKALLRAAKIADERKDRSALQVADVRTQLGDWYQVRGQPDRAVPQYQLAWQAAKDAPDRIEGRPLVEALFAQPALLYLSRPDGWNRYSERPPDQVEVRSVRVEFTVNPKGRVEAAKVTDDSGDEKRGSKTQDAIEGARYRPRLENGQPVATNEVSYSQPWILLLPEAEDVEQDTGQRMAPASADADRGNAAGRQ